MSGLTNSAPEFQAFIDWSRAARRARPFVASFCETRIARAFASIRPVVDATERGTVHRCDLARDWCSLRGMPRFAERALVCEGVRHALSLTFPLLRRANQRLVMPRDVYPVYLKLAAQAGLSFAGVDTFPEFDLESIFATCLREGATQLLLPNPLKLHGRWWTQAEVALTVSWLSQRPERRLIVDGVYSFGLPLHESIRALLETDQVVYLDSLSKGWLHEAVFGAAVFPVRDFAQYVTAFRNAAPAQHKLHTAQQLLREFPELPRQLSSEMQQRRAALGLLLAHSGVRVLPATNGYLLAIEGEAQSLLEERALLTIPFRVFGGILPNWSMASALPSGLDQ